MNSLLFPFEKVKYDAHIVIYGAGEMGIEYYRQMRLTKYCSVMAFVDRNASDGFLIDGIPVVSVDSINDYIFDYVIVAVKARSWWKRINDDLNQKGIGNEKIVFGEIREDGFSIKKEICKESMIRGEVRNDSLDIALYITGGYGDCIISKSFVDKLICLCPNSDVDIFTASSSSEEFIKTLYYNCPYIRKIKTNVAMEYQNCNKKYDLAITISGSGFVLIDYLNSERLSLYGNTFFQKMLKLKKATDEQEYSANQCIYPIYYQRIYKGQNAYTAFSYDGILDINDSNVRIDLDESVMPTYESLKLKNYITINCGNGTRKGDHAVAKSWPTERFDKVVEMFKCRFKGYEVIQIGAADAPILHNANRYFLGEDFKLVEYILRNAVFHLDIEGGMVHLATQLGTKCVVLFGQSNEAYYSYETNINIKAGNCHGCAGLYKDINRCARDLDEPECMYSITPELVMKYVDEYMSSIEVQ